MTFTQPIQDLGPKNNFFTNFPEDWYMDAHYITDYGNNENSVFSPPGGGSSKFVAVLAVFSTFSILPILLGHNNENN